MSFGRALHNWNYDFDAEGIYLQIHALQGLLYLRESEKNNRWSYGICLRTCKRGWFPTAVFERIYWHGTRFVYNVQFNPTENIHWHLAMEIKERELLLQLVLPPFFYENIGGIVRVPAATYAWPSSVHFDALEPASIQWPCDYATARRVHLSLTNVSNNREWTEDMLCGFMIQLEKALSKHLSTSVTFDMELHFQRPRFVSKSPVICAPFLLKHVKKKQFYRNSVYAFLAEGELLNFIAHLRGMLWLLSKEAFSNYPLFHFRALQEIHVTAGLD